MGRLIPFDAESDRLIALTFACCDAVHRELGPGLLRATYQQALCRELSRRSIPFQTAVKFPVFSRGIRLDACHVIDLCVFGRVLVDVLAGEKILSAHCTALQARLRLTGVRAGLVTNYRSARLLLSTLVVRDDGAFCLSARMARAARRIPVGGSMIEPRVRQEVDDRISTSRGERAFGPAPGL
jgi:GxxExxY protein